MAISKCKECGGQVASSAKACPHCGAKVKKKVGVLGWLFVLVVVLPIAYSIGSGMGKAPTTTPVTSTQASGEARPDLPNLPSQPKPEVSPWTLHEYTEAMTDKKAKVLRIRSKNTTNFEFPYNVSGGSGLTLSFRRVEGALDAYLQIDKGQMLCHRNDCRFSLRVGDGKVQQWTGLPSSTHDSDIMFVRDAAQLEAIVKKGGAIRVGIDFYRAGTRAFEFDLGKYPGM
ncbi:zinc ribbon domain-containing protein [Pseudomonas sp. KSR10]|uniref:zinc ribbon domain-containing protein n=1 Tax=Pseudomonas sp. KSR10 TaxID=2916654 RepID=UPI001EF8D83D|nr:zinc ribbon domain-containing protein [Pseudomonas sp. KSR10]MCG6540166.1 zinc ribbon domain-containing protein [Pseudomonas sp. KSR10]